MTRIVESNLERALRELEVYAESFPERPIPKTQWLVFSTQDGREIRIAEVPWWRRVCTRIRKGGRP